ncbi:unnamed protein product [Lupinus luteus]|uniref:Uncharacterized protein n=1 Tax=Lupinus luteus TaxID=3873 RepID=A0AAV1WN52_LUPLU
MRTHPNRPWTGVRPPIHSHHHKRSSSDLEEDRDDVDDDRVDISKSFSLPKWQKTGKRGRMSTSVYDAAKTLMLMSSRNYNCHAIKSMMAEPKFHQSSMIACKRKNIGEVSTSEIKKNHGSMTIEGAVQDHADNVDEKEMKLMKLLVKNLKVPNSESETNKKVNKVINMAELKSSDHAIVDDGTMRALVMMEASIDEVKIEEDASSTQILGPKILDFDLNLTADEDEHIYSL